MSVELFIEPLNKRYYAPRCSCAYLVYAICTILVITIPFLLCNSSAIDGIWLKHDSYKEKPNIGFSHMMIIELLSNFPDDEEVSEIFFSTIGSLSDLRSGSSRTADVRSRQIDDDLDGVMDQLNVNVMVPLLEQERVQSIKAILFLECKFEKNVKVEMESIAYVNHDSSLPGTSFATRGDLVFRQTVPLVASDTLSSIYQDEHLLNDGAAPFHIRSTNIDTILQKYSTRNFAVDYKERFPFWGGISFDKTSTSDVFNFTFTIDVDEQQIDFIPTLPDVLKDFWIRYLSLLLLVGYFLKKATGFMFSHQMVQTNVVTESH